MRRLGLTINSLVAVGVAAIAIFAVAGCSGSDDDSGAGTAQQSDAVLTVGLAAPVTDLDSTRGNGLSTVNALGMEGLMRQLPDGTAEPWLAETVDQPDPLTFVYHLREGVKFWNGNELTSADVVNAFDYYRRGESLQSSYFDRVKSVEAKDRYTVVVRLSKPDVAWEQVVANPSIAIFEKAFQDKHGEKMGRPGVLTMGTGPWKFDSLDPTRGVELSANEDYWGEPPAFGRISIKYFEDESGMALAFRRGEIDVAPWITDARAFTASSGAELRDVPQCWLESFLMPTTTPPWDDVHVRRAVAYALNREELMAARGVEATAVTTPLVLPSQLETLASESEVAELTASLPTYEYDPEKAKAELAKSAYPDGFSSEFPTVREYFGNDPQVVAAQLAEIGIELDVSNIQPADWFSRLSTKRNIPSVTYAPCVNGDAGDFFLNYLSSNGVNGAAYEKPPVGQLLEDTVTTYDDEERFAAFGRLLEQLAADVPYVPLFSEHAVAAISDDIDWSSFSGNWGFRNWAMDIEPAQ